jgi:hypothetical protein
LGGLVQEYLFINLYLVAVESFASGQASRLVAPAAGDERRAMEWVLGDE